MHVYRYIYLVRLLTLSLLTGQELFDHTVQTDVGLVGFSFQVEERKASKRPQDSDSDLTYQFPSLDAKTLKKVWSAALLVIDDIRFSGK